MIIQATIRAVWPKSAQGVFSVIVQEVGKFDRRALWTRDEWLASLADRYDVPTGRPVVPVNYDPATREILGVAMPTTGEVA
jgi:hypothetical protein